MLNRLEENPRLLRVFARSGPVLVACWIAALCGYGRFIPDKSPSEPASVIRHFYLHHMTARNALICDKARRVCRRP